MTVETSKVFISYSRRDAEFTRKLYAGLESHELVTWVDWEGIPLTADWMEEIREAIESADAFIFIISPDSIKSEVCNKELDLAIASNKRLVPILRRMPTRKIVDEEMNETLAATNWVYMRDEDNFEATLPELVEAINTDLGHVKEHTRIQGKALEWERQERDHSYTLRGSDLDGAETWLSDARARSPQPTFLQSEYILVSRQDAAARQRQTLFIVAGALVVSIFLGILAFTNFQIAQQQTQLATSRQLAAEAFIENLPDLGMLLSVEALEFADTTQARTSLFSNLAQYSSLNESLQGYSGDIEAIVYGPEAVWVAVLGADNNISIWDIDNPTELRVIEYDSNADLEGKEMVITANGALIAVGDNTGGVTLVDTVAEKVVAKLTGQSSEIQSLAFSPDGSLVAAGADDGQVVVWNTENGRVEYTLTNHESRVVGLAFHPNGRFLASGDKSGRILVTNLKFGSPREFVEDGHNDDVNGLAFSREGAYLYSASDDTRILVWDVSEAKIVNEYSQHTRKILALKVSPDGRYLATSGEDQRALLWNIVGDELHFDKELQGHTNFVRDVAFSPDSAGIGSVSNGMVLLWHTGLSEIGQISGHEDTIRRVAFHPDGWMLASSSDANELLVWDSVSGRKLFDFEFNDAVFALDFSPDGHYLAAGDRSGLVRVWDVRDFSEVLIFEDLVGYDAIESMAFRNDNRTLALGVQGQHSLTPILLDILDGTMETLEWPNADANRDAYVRWVDFSPHGSQLAATYWGSATVVFTLGSDGVNTDEIGVVEKPERFGLSVQYSPVGNLMAISYGDNTVDILNASDFEKLYTIDEHGGWVHGLAFSLDGDWLATASADRTVKVWNMPSGDLFANLIWHDGEAISVDFHPDGGRLVTGSDDRLLMIWNIDVEHARAHVCGVANRSLELGEWERFIGLEIGDFHQLCVEIEPE